MITLMWKIVDSPEFYMQCIFNNPESPFLAEIYAVALIFKHRNSLFLLNLDFVLQPIVVPEIQTS